AAGMLSYWVSPGCSVYNGPLAPTRCEPSGPETRFQPAGYCAAAAKRAGCTAKAKASATKTKIKAMRTRRRKAQAPEPRNSRGARGRDPATRIVALLLAVHEIRTDGCPSVGCASGPR